MEPPRLDSNVFQKPFQESEFSPCIEITFQVMAVPGVSPGYPYAVRPMPEGGQDKLGAYPGRARNTNDPKMAGILKSAYTGQVSRPVTAPVA